MVKRTVSDLASEVLRHVEAEEMVKTAERQLLQAAMAPTTSEVAGELLKLATACRNSVDDSILTRDDINAFMKRACHA